MKKYEKSNAQLRIINLIFAGIPELVLALLGLDLFLFGFQNGNRSLLVDVAALLALVDGCILTSKWVLGLLELSFQSLFSLSLFHSVKLFEEACCLQVVVHLKFFMEFELLDMADSDVDDGSNLTCARLSVGRQVFFCDFMFLY